MAKEQTSIRERQRTKLREPKRYKVTIYNDDFTTMEFVVMILKVVFFKSEALDFAVDASYKYVNDRFLPDKAIDLIDEIEKAHQDIYNILLQVTMTLSDEAFALFLKEGFTREYGAREMDRVIAQRLKPLLMREILFGSLKNGGSVEVEVADGSLSIR